ncbi:MAG: nickel pincer cofactor biosynthesis protein LarB [Deltaproteobacteria bacterium]|nr:nickel pincer cofactor biosynthesis protein LarB [Deltaproteobacteria bacterium]MBW2479961.1 nickel pincer cofactor biosynthesis protein LarB [Deltaproteobacteria bacterium]
MDKDQLRQVLQAVAEGRTDATEAAKRLEHLAYEDITYAHIDHHRSLRKGFPEVIFGEGKTAEQIAGIMDKMKDQENIILVTRIDAQKAEVVLSHFPGAVYHADARMVVLKIRPVVNRGRGPILIISAGTSDIPVAKEAYLTAEAMGNTVETIFDVGVSGIHRLLNHHEAIDQANVLIVVAGMEGALPSVVAGMVDRPVIAVPTSVGYGVNLGGLTALFAMLNSCSSNVAVVNIDNGFGAGYMASAINRK